jgi:hypothetical protein
MNAAQEAYDRLIAAQRHISREEWAEIEKDREREVKNRRIAAKLPKVV